jgi:hypothetical protein
MDEKIYSNLLLHMSRAVNVPHWNDLREAAKKDFPQWYIYRLDGSGYISKVLN